MPPTLPLPGPPMPAWLKHGLASGIVFFCCWGGVIAYWRLHRSAPAAPDMAVYLLALPAALLLLFWGAGKVVASRQPVPAAASGTGPQRAGAVPAQAAPLAILAAALRSPHGASVGELAAALAANRTCAALDPALVDADGFPVMTARSTEAHDDMLRADIGTWLRHKGMAALQFSEDQWRALTLASAVTSDLVMRATDELVDGDAVAPMLQLMPLLPDDWQAGQRRVAAMWLRHTAAQFGWPVDRICIDAAASTDPAPAAAFARLARSGDHPAPALALVVACASHLSQQRVDDWAARGLLFSPSRPDGLIPGEGAAGLLVANLAQARSIESMAYVLLDRIEETRLDAAADAAPLSTLLESVCGRAGVGSEEIAMVIGDAGRHPDRLLELTGFVGAALPRLDAAADVVRIGSGGGNCEAVPFMTGLALARYYTLEREASSLFASNEDPYRRSVALVRSALSLPLK